jgi:hypothetical protein
VIREAYISVILHETGSDLGTLGVEGNSEGSSTELLGGSSGVVNDRLVVLVGSVGKVHSHWGLGLSCASEDSPTNVHTGVLEGDEHVDIVGLGTNGSNDGRLSC